MRLKRPRVPRFVVPLVVLGVVAMLYVRPISSYAETRDQLAERRAEVASLRVDRDRAAARLERATSLDELARDARLIGYVRPGEHLFIVKGIAAWKRQHAARADPFHCRPVPSTFRPVDDRAVVAAQLGREPRTFRRVAVRCPWGFPAVTEQDPYGADGEPFPTTYYLTCRSLVAAVSRLEAAGGVERWSAAVAEDDGLREALERATEEQVACAASSRPAGRGRTTAPR